MFSQSQVGFEIGIFEFPNEKILSQASETTIEQKYCLNLTYIYVINCKEFFVNFKEFLSLLISEGFSGLFLGSVFFLQIRFSLGKLQKI